MDIDSKLARIPDSLKDEYKNISDYQVIFLCHV